MKKWEKLTAKASHIFFQQKILAYFRYCKVWNFNKTLTNDIVSFEQLGPGLYNKSVLSVIVSFDFL